MNRSWYPMTPMLQGRSNFSAVVLDGKLVVIGGYDGKIPPPPRRSSAIHEGWGGLQKYFLTDCFVFYTSSVIFQSCNGGAKNIIYLNISVDVYSYLFQTIVHVYIKSHFLHHSLHQWSSSLCLHFKILILCTVHYCVE